MTMKRFVTAIGAGVLALGIGTGLYASVQNTNQGPPPFRGRGMGPGGPGRGDLFGPGGPMGMLPMLARELGITDAQKDQIKAIAESHRDEWKGLAARGRTAHQALNAAVTADAVDENLIRQRSAEAAAVDADIAVARARAHAEVFQVLTPEQKAKAKDRRAQAQARMKERGPGRGR